MNYKVLVVHDEEGILRLLKNYFEINGFLVYTAYNGIEDLYKVPMKPGTDLLAKYYPEGKISEEN